MKLTTTCVNVDVIVSGKPATKNIKPVRQWLQLQLNGSVKEPNNFRNYETEKITRKASDARYIELFGSSA